MKPSLPMQFLYALALWVLVPFVFAWVAYDRAIGKRFRNLS